MLLRSIPRNTRRIHRTGSNIPRRTKLSNTTTNIQPPKTRNSNSIPTNIHTRHKHSTSSIHTQPNVPNHRILFINLLRRRSNIPNSIQRIIFRSIPTTTTSTIHKLSNTSTNITNTPNTRKRRIHHDSNGRSITIKSNNTRKTKRPTLQKRTKKRC